MVGTSPQSQAKAQRDPNDKRQFREVENDVNALSIQYGRKCEKQRAHKDLSITVNFWKKKDLLAIPFDKGCEFYVMNKSRKA